MAGKPKRGLEYFSCDVDMLEHMKIRRLIDREGIIGFGTYIVLLMDIYRIGQFLEFDDIDDVIFNIASRLKVNESETGAALESIMNLKLLDKDSYEAGYITSKGVQERYILSTKRRKVRLLDESRLLTEKEISLLDFKIVYKDGMFVNKDSIDVYKNEQSKSNSKSKSKSKTKKDELMNKDLGKIPLSSLPFKPDYYYQMFYNQDILDGSEKKTKEINDLFIDFRSMYDEDELHKAIVYTASRIKENNWLDANGKEIRNKYSYLKETIENNIYVVQSNIADMNDDRPFEEKLLDKFPGLKQKKN